MYELIDTHCHLDDKQFAADRDAILDRCRRSGITKIVVPAIQRNNWDSVLALCSTSDSLYPALGLHPMFTNKHHDADIVTLDDYLKQHSVVAIGEIGLDYYSKDADRDRQKYFFEQQLQLAHIHQLPVLLHVRKAHADTIELLKKHRPVGGIAHAYNGSLEQAREYLKLGFKLGFGGMLTYERATKIRQLAQELPLTAIVLETDAPDMVGFRHKGERNSPEYLLDALSSLAEIRHDSQQVIAEQTTKNALDIFMGAV